MITHFCGIISIPEDVSVTTFKNIEVSLVTYLSMTSSVDLTGVTVLVSNLINAVNSTTTGTMVTGVSVEIPSNEGTVANEALEISFSLPPSGFVEFKYKFRPEAISRIIQGYNISITAHG